MKKSMAAVCGISRILFSAGTFGWFFCFLIVITEAGDVRLSPLWPVIGLAAVYCAGRIASLRGIKLLNYVLLQILVCAAGIALIQLNMRLGAEVLRLRVLSSIAFAIAAVVCAKDSVADIRPESLTHRFDAGIILTALLIFSDHYLDIAYGKTALAVLLLAILVILLALTMLRTERHAAVGNAAGRVIPFVLMALIVLISAAVALLGSGAAQSITGAAVSAIRGLFSLIGAGAVFLWTQWTRFCSWLASLFDPVEGGGEEIIVPEPQQDGPGAAEFSRTSIIVLYVLTALIVIAALVAIILAIRRIRLRRVKTSIIDNRQAERRGGLFDGLKKSFEILAEKLRYRVYCIRYRNTPAGLLAWCERRVARADRRRRDEAGPQFLLRLSEGKSGEDAETLRALSGIIEKAFYSREGAAAAPELCAAVRRCRFR